MRVRLRTLARVLGALIIGAGLAFALAMVLPHRRARRDAGPPADARAGGAEASHCTVSRSHR